MKRTILTVALGMLMTSTLSAQGYRNSIDSLITYLESQYSGGRKDKFSDRHNFTNRPFGYLSLTIPVSGDDEKLREVTANVVSHLSQFPSLQAYSERVDNQTGLHGRYVAKLKPIGADSVVYAYFKYDRNLITLKHNWNFPQASPATDVVQSSTDEMPPVWADLNDIFELESSLSHLPQPEQKWWYLPFDNWEKLRFLYVSNPAPKNGDMTKVELTRYKTRFEPSRIRELMELAGKEEGSVYDSVAVKDIKYFHVIHTYPSGRVEYIGLTQDAEYTYLARATSRQKGIYLTNWYYLWDDKLKALRKDLYK